MLQCLRTHALQLGSEAMVSPLPAAPPRSVEVASSAAFAAESPRWPSHRAAESVSKLEGAQEAGWLNGAPRFPAWAQRPTTTVDAHRLAAYKVSG